METRSRVPFCPESRAKPAGQRPTAPSRRRRDGGTTRVLLQCFGNELLQEVRHHKAPEPIVARAHPAVRRCPETLQVARFSVAGDTLRRDSVMPHFAPGLTNDPDH